MKKIFILLTLISLHAPADQKKMYHIVGTCTFLNKADGSISLPHTQVLIKDSVLAKASQTGTFVAELVDGKTKGKKIKCPLTSLVQD